MFCKTCETGRRHVSGHSQGHRFHITGTQLLKSRNLFLKNQSVVMQWLLRLRYVYRATISIQRADCQPPVVHLRLSFSHQLTVPLMKLSTYGICSFAVPGPTVCNNFPDCIEIRHYSNTFFSFLLTCMYKQRPLQCVRTLVPQRCMNLITVLVTDWLIDWLIDWLWTGNRAACVYQWSNSAATESYISDSWQAGF